LRESRRGKKTNKHDPTAEDIDTIDSILYAALGDDKFCTNAQSFARLVLEGLGLIHPTDGLEYVPSRLLRKLAAERRNEDRFQEVGEYLRANGMMAISDSD
jgi:hypothetical protein